MNILLYFPLLKKTSSDVDSFVTYVFVLYYRHHKVNFRICERKHNVPFITVYNQFSSHNHQLVAIIFKIAIALYMINWNVFNIRNDINSTYKRQTNLWHDLQPVAWSTTGGMTYNRWNRETCDIMRTVFNFRSPRV